MAGQRTALAFGVGLAAAIALGGQSRAATNWDHYLFTGITHPISVFLTGFAEEVKKRTNGELVITPRPAGELPFRATEVVKITGDGLVQMGSAYAGFISGSSPISGVTGLPFLVRTYEDLEKTWPIIEKYSTKELQKAGVKTLFHFSWPPQNLYGAGQPIRTLEDFKGRKLRTTDAKQAEMMRRLGASSVTLTTAEVPVAMERGLMEGMTTAAFNVIGAKWYEFIKWGWLPEIHIGGPNYELVNIAAYNKLPANVRATLDEVAKEWSAKMLKEIAAVEGRDRKALEDNYKISLYVPPKEQVDELTKRMEDYWVAWGEQNGPDGVALVKEIRAALGR